MKNFLFLALLAFTAHANAIEFKSQEEIVKKLSAYSMEDIKGDFNRGKKDERLKIDDMYDDIEAAGKFLVGKKPTEDVAFELQRVLILTMFRDRLGHAFDFFIDIYSVNTPVFEEAAKRFQDYDRDVTLKPLIDGALSTRKNGDG
jgi:hypothetical protein